MTDADIKQAMRVISQVNGTPLAEDRIDADLPTYKSFLAAIDRISRVDLPREAAPLPFVNLKRG